MKASNSMVRTGAVALLTASVIATGTVGAHASTTSISETSPAVGQTLQVSNSTSVVTVEGSEGDLTVYNNEATGEITVVEEDGTETVFNEDQLLADLEASAGVSETAPPEGVAVASFDAKSYLCNLAVGTASGLHGYAWQTALTMAKFHPVARVATAGGEIAFAAWVSSHC